MTQQGVWIRFRITNCQFRDLSGCLISCRRDTERIVSAWWRATPRDAYRTLGQGQRGLERFCQWLVLREIAETGFSLDQIHHRNVAGSVKTNEVSARS